MKKSIIFWMSTILVLATGISLQAREVPGAGDNGKKKFVKRTMNELCSPATAQTDLDLNNVRARVLAAGDMWWNLTGQPRYEVPKGSNRHSMFAGALWLGGLDEGAQLRLAAMTYRQRGNDFWPGPLTDDGTASVTNETCSRYDRFWTITREEVEIHRAWLQCVDDPDCNDGEAFPGYEIPLIIREWPGNGIPDYDSPLPFRLAPFEDVDGDGLYDPMVDYPGYDLDRQYDCRLKEIDVLYGDKTIWWVYNDRGNVHAETAAGALGFEIRAQAFAFSTNDEINSMTFYNYRILNKSTFTLTNTYFGTWFDPDLGNPIDDLIGCDIPRGLGYCYNANPVDAGPIGYGANPPAIGFDFFQGPFADYFDGLDNDKDGCIDAVRDSAGNCIPENPALGINERIIMSGFMYYNRSDFSNQDMVDPRFGNEFYRYLQNRWRNGNPLVYTTSGGIGSANNGNGFTPDGSGTRTLFAYPGLSYDTTASGRQTENLFDHGTFPPFEPWPNGGWFEPSTELFDKRGLHTAGPFTLEPGALNFITTGAVWARDFTNPDPYASVELLKVADDKAQSLFDNCFQILDGPDAPLVSIESLDRELILKISYPSTSNNFNFGYRQADPLIVEQPDWDNDPALIDSARRAGYFEYAFEGIQVFQFRNADVTSADLYNPDLSRLVFQCDIENEHAQLINYERAPDLNNAFVPQDMTIEANNSGIQSSFRITQDAFSDQLDGRLINHTEYYYYVIAYAVNQFRPFSPAEPDLTQQTPYLSSRRSADGGSIQVQAATPHKTEFQKDGLTLASQYGDSPEITRLDGMGNMGRFLELTEMSEDAIVNTYKVDQLTYRKNQGPVNIKVVNPKKVRPGNFTLKFDGPIASNSDRLTNNTRWLLEGTYINEDGDEVVLGFDPNLPNNPGGILSDTTIGFNNEQIISELGISINVLNARNPAEDEACEFGAGVIGSEVVYSDPTKPWITGTSSNNSFTPLNWILAGTNTNTAAGTANRIYRDRMPDPCDNWNLINRTWAPYSMVSRLRFQQDDNNHSQGFGPAFEGNNSSGDDADVNVGRSRSVDIVITSDKSKWTRVPVFEMAEDPIESADNITNHELRTARGWILQGDQLVRSDRDEDRGWSYFPGYAIDIETGVRLSMAFGENTWLVGDNGNDMLWNPSSRIATAFNLTMGGMHYLYVFNPTAVSQVAVERVDITYKGSDVATNPLNVNFLQNPTSRSRRVFWASVQYVHVPLQNPAFANVDPYGETPGDVRYKIRMNRAWTEYKTEDQPNDGLPMYGFNTNDIAASVRQPVVATDALDLIRVVPNPYYAYSRYEQSQLDNIVKITNLPDRCDIHIYTTAGTKIRSFRKDNTLPSVDWDLTNDYGIPIASGVYIIHVDAGERGNKVLKWFGAMRPVDLNAF